MLRRLATPCLVIHIAAAVSFGFADAPSDLSRWVEMAPPEGSRWGVANASKHDWVVTLHEGRPHVRPWNAKDGIAAPLPFEAQPPSSKGRRLSVQVPDGWIVSDNAGEFGGEIEWYSPDGKDHYSIAKAHVRGFVATAEGLLAIEGLAHLSISRGRILRLTHPPGGRWRSEEWLDLKGAPATFAEAADGSLTIATTDRLLRVVPATKEVEVLLGEVFWGGLYPNSMVLTPDGTIYLGMRHGVAKIAKQGKAYKALWLLPSKDFK